MSNKLAVIVMGNRNSGKSRTWNSLFGETVRTGKYLRKLPLADNQYVDSFLVSGSPEERGQYVGDLVGSQSPSIILCSMQYKKEAISTIDYFLNEGYSIYLHWLNPGFNDQNNGMFFDSVGLLPYLLASDATVAIRNGKEDDVRRVQEIRSYIYGWAFYNKLLK